jgi:hypothetical protein
VEVRWVLKIVTRRPFVAVRLQGWRQRHLNFSFGSLREMKESARAMKSPATRSWIACRSLKACRDQRATGAGT